MPIIGFNFEKVSAQKTGKVLGNVNISHTINITNVKKEEITLEKKQDVLKFEFEFKVDYAPKMGNISLEGSVIYLDDLKNLQEIEDSWKKNKKLSPEITAIIINTVLVKSNIKALILSQDVNLPPQIQLPKTAPAKSNVKAEEYIG
ncbi:MAG: hypothetical protein KJ674_02855 [Nanoarchaeota archaeon]|nr:hypothetical protein [Nanoarchaeota archaeon]